MLGRRLRPEHRPWVAAQITAPSFASKRTRGILPMQVLFIVVPQLLIAATTGSWLNLLIAGFGLVGFGLAVVLFRESLTADQTRRLLAHHGVTADGALVQPVSLWQTSRLGRSATALLAVSILVLGTGVIVVGDHFVSPDRCRSVSAVQVAAVEALLGQTMVQGGPASPPLFQGAQLQHAQRVDGGLAGMSYLSAYVSGTPGADRVGPAVWRILEPGGALPVQRIDVSAVDLPAQELTPTAGYSTSTPPEPLVAKARRCARDVRD